MTTPANIDDIRAEAGRNKRIVCLVVADEAGSFKPIGGDELTEKIRWMLDSVYGFSGDEINHFMQVVLGNEQPD